MTLPYSWESAVHRDNTLFWWVAEMKVMVKRGSHTLFPITPFAHLSATTDDSKSWTEILESLKKVPLTHII